MSTCSYFLFCVVSNLYSEEIEECNWANESFLVVESNKTFRYVVNLICFNERNAPYWRKFLRKIFEHVSLNEWLKYKLSGVSFELDGVSFEIRWWTSLRTRRIC